MTNPSQLLVEETLRLYRRYQLEIVEALNLCPWAKRARQDGKVDPRVSLADTADTRVVLDAIDAWMATPDVEIGLLLFPRLRITRADFERFATSSMKADAQRHGLSSPQFVIAAFHPDAGLSLDNAERLIPFWRRTPDPTLQVVRMTALERVRQGEASGTQFVDPSTLDFSKLPQPNSASLWDRVSANNLRTAQHLGDAALRDLFERIQDDHRRTRQRLEQDPEPRDAPD